MKKWITFIILISLFSCKKLEEFTEFDIIYHTEATIPATIGINVPFDIPLPPVTTNSEQTFENNNTHKDLIEEIRLKELEIKITEPVSGDFSFLRDIEIYINTDGQSEKKIAWLYNIPNNVGNTLNLETTNHDLQEYVKTDSFTIRMKVTTDELITQDYTVDIKTVFFVNAKILGL